MEELPITEVLSRYGLTACAEAAVERTEGANTRVIVAADGGRVTVRRSGPTRTRAWLEMEAAALAHLAAADLPAVRQRKTADGEAFFQRDGRFYAVFDTPQGRSVDPPSDRQLHTLARLHARLHDALAEMPHAARFADTAASFRPRKSWSFLVPLAAGGRFCEQLDLPARLAAAGDRPAHAEVAAGVAECRRRIEAIAADLPELSGQLVPGDFTQHTVLFDADGAATVGELDLLLWDSPAADVARTLNAVARFGTLGPFLPVRAAAYLRAYQGQRPMDEAARAAISGLVRLVVLQWPLFHALRYLEAAEAAWAGRWAQMVAADLARDEELVRLGTSWTTGGFQEACR